MMNLLTRSRLCEHPTLTSFFLATPCAFIPADVHVYAYRHNMHHVCNTHARVLPTPLAHSQAAISLSLSLSLFLSLSLSIYLSISLSLSIYIYIYTYIPQYHIAKPMFQNFSSTMNLEDVCVLGVASDLRAKRCEESGATNAFERVERTVTSPLSTRLDVSSRLVSASLDEWRIRVYM